MDCEAAVRKGRRRRRCGCSGAGADATLLHLHNCRGKEKRTRRGLDFDSRGAIVSGEVLERFATLLLLFILTTAAITISSAAAAAAASKEGRISLLAQAGPLLNAILNTNAVERRAVAAGKARTVRRPSGRVVRVNGAVRAGGAAVGVAVEPQHHPRHVLRKIGEGKRRVQRCVKASDNRMVLINRRRRGVGLLILVVSIRVAVNIICHISVERADNFFSSAIFAVSVGGRKGGGGLV